MCTCGSRHNCIEPNKHGYTLLSQIVIASVISRGKNEMHWYLEICPQDCRQAGDSRRYGRQPCYPPAFQTTMRENTWLATYEEQPSNIDVWRVILQLVCGGMKRASALFWRHRHVTHISDPTQGGKMKWSLWCPIASNFTSSRLAIWNRSGSNHFDSVAALLCLSTEAIWLRFCLALCDFKSRDIAIWNCCGCDSAIGHLSSLSL